MLSYLDFYSTVLCAKFQARHWLNLSEGTVQCAKGPGIGSFASRWKRRLSIMARRSMMQQAYYALRKHLRNDLQSDDDEVYDDDL